LQGKAASPHRALYWVWNQGKNQQWQAMREGTYKLLRSAADAPWELYDLAQDIGEQRDLAASRPATVKELAQHFDQWRAEVGSDPTRSTSLRKKQDALLQP